MKANRLTLMWAFPFGAGLALFGADLVVFVLGDEWRGAIVLLGGLAVAVALQQVGYSWFAFYRARGESWPQAVESAAFGAAFVALAIPGALLGGSWGFVAGRLGCTACLLAVRRAYVRRLLPSVSLGAMALRAALPVALASAPVLAVRLTLWGGERTLAQALARARLVARGSRARHAPARARPARRVARLPARGRPGVRVALLWAAAALISGFTLRRHIGPLDEGILMQAASRMADGQWPWRDFGWAYGPGEPLFVWAANALFDPSLLWWRILRVAADATAAVLIWALVRDARPRWALPAWAAAAVTAAQPVSANPTAPALAFALGAVLLASRGHPASAGVAAAAAAFFRPDVGVLAAIAAAATLVVAERRRAGAGAAATAPRQPGPGGAAHAGLGARRGLASPIVCLLVAALAGVALYAPFVVAAGPGQSGTRSSCRPGVTASGGGCRSRPASTAAT